MACTLSGSGTSDSPYLVATADELAQVGSVCGLASAYRQTANITLDSPATGSSNHSPIGRSVTRFTGSYDGTGKLIIGLMINAPASDSIGLFGGTEGATLNDIHLIDARVSGNSDVGALVGYADSGTSITDCSATGAVSGAGSVGGLVGGLLSQSDAPSSVERSQAAVGVSATGSASGGLVGRTGIAAAVLYSRATGRVEGTQYVGGNSAKLTKTGKAALRKVYATASAGTITKLKVTGVVNTRSYSLFTKRLVQARASAVVNYLKKLGYTGTVSKATAKGTKRAKSRKADLVFAYTVTPC